MDTKKKAEQNATAPIDKKNFAFGKLNFILIAAGVLVILLGFFLMAGGEPTPEKFDPSIFDAIHIKVAPVVTLIGFLTIIVAIIIKPKDK